MPIKFRCKSCQQVLSITRRKAGTLVRCPKCGNELQVPRLREESRAAPVEPRPDALAAAVASMPAADDVSAPPPPAPVALPDDDDDSFGPRRDMEFEEMDLTPMVDVTFLLLIFFMVTASFSLQKVLNIPVPDPDDAGAVATEVPETFDESIRVEIDAENVIRVEDEVVEDRSLIADKIREKSTSDRKNELLLVRDPRAFHETTVTVVDAAHAAGVQKIRVTAATAN
jgi:biopolymer transport protein ExbD